MWNLIQSITWSINTIANFFSTLFSGISSVITFISSALDFIMYSVKTIFSLFTSLF